MPNGQGFGLFDPYALKKVSLAGFAAAVLPSVPPPQSEQHAARVRWMAARLRELERRHKDVAFVCSLLDVSQRGTGRPVPSSHEQVTDQRRCTVLI